MRMSARMIVVGLALLGFVVLAFGLAEDADGASFVGVAYCVDAPGTGSPASGCTGTNEPSLQSALSQAAMDPAGTVDSITLPAGTFTGQFTYSNAGTGGQANLSVIGQGAGSTYINGSISDAAGLERNAVISSLTVQMPSGQNGATGVLLNGTIGSVEYVKITGADETGGEGVSIHSGEVFDASVVLSGGAHDVAVSASGENDSVYGSTLSANTALLADPGSTGASVQRSVLEGSGTGGQAALFDDAASSILQDSVLSATGGATALEAESAADVTSVTAKQLTVVGDAASTGVAALASGGTSASIAMTDSIIADPLAHSITQSVTGGSGNATVTTDYTDYDDATAPTGYVPGAHDPASYLVPGFIAPTGSTPNYRLGPTSPLLSYDTTTPSVFGSSPTDLDGLPRMTDSGRALGAYQHQSPTVTASATPTQIAACLRRRRHAHRHGHHHRSVRLQRCSDGHRHRPGRQLRRAGEPVRLCLRDRGRDQAVGQPREAPLPALRRARDQLRALARDDPAARVLGDPAARAGLRISARAAGQRTEGHLRRWPSDPRPGGAGTRGTEDHARRRARPWHAARRDNPGGLGGVAQPAVGGTCDRPPSAEAARHRPCLSPSR
jgi:hypothetical protein